MPPPGGSTAHAPASPEGRRRRRADASPAEARGGQGCLIAAAIGSALLMVAAVLVIGYTMYTSGRAELAPEPPVEGEPLAEHSELPSCAAVEAAGLETLVPDPELRGDDTQEQEGWEVRDCQWSSASVGYGEYPGFAAVLFVRNLDDTAAQLTGAEIASEDLAVDLEEHGGTVVDGLGDQAASWYNTDDEVGCVGAVTSNLYTVVCHDAQDEGGDWGGLGQDEAIAGAEALAERVVPRVAVGEY
jgi:hypothetical protein